MTELPKTYDPNGVEPEIYAKWEQAGAFAPVDNPDAVPFCIINPPTNANGALHIGHAVGVTLQDLMIRYHRMKGDAALWLPGFDHAGFETQVVYEKVLDKQGRNRFDIPREQLYQEMYDFTQANKSVIENQFKKLGASLDWSREMFTLDPRVVDFVYKTFKQLHDDGLAYRSERPVNWCTKHQTSLSDLEVKFEDRADPLYYLKYGPLTVATVRPETTFGDVAVAVHPNDQRYQAFVGKKITVELASGPIELPVIADDYVNPEFGTGALKITPAHDPNDFEVAKRHGLPTVEAIDRYGRLTEVAQDFAGLKIKEARQKVVDALKAKGLIEKIDQTYRHSVGVCYKCNTAIEPRVLPQWFIAMTHLRDEAVAAVKNNRTKFATKRFENLFYAWMRELRDWNVSRQIVWGIQLPVWYCEKANCEPVVTDGSTPEVCPQCGANKLTRDPDVFDTWFSSAQWPMAALAAGENNDFERFYPTAVMETGYDILFFWVARMIMLGLYRTGEVPFKEVYLHGMVRDQERQKMSKSKGNVIDPLGVAEQYGSDAVRMALIFGTSAGNDIVIGEEKIRGMRNFANKVWNIGRFVMMQLENNKEYELISIEDLKGPWPEDGYISNDIKVLRREVTRQIESMHFHLAAENIYDFIWHKFADEYLEGIKERLKTNDPIKQDATQRFLLSALHIQLVLLHPFMPFLTESIHQHLPIKNKLSLLMASPWPK